MKSTKRIFHFLLLLSLVACISTQKMAKISTATFFVSTATDLPTEGIYVYSIDLETGASTLKHKETGIINPSFLTISSSNQFLYALERIKGETENKVRAYKITETSGLKLLNQQSTKGKGACYISLDEADENVFIAHYGSGSIVNLPILSDGSLSAVSDLIQHEGSSIDQERQQSPHPHFIHQGIQNKVYAPDLGMDKVMLYETKNGTLTAAQPSHLTLKPGSGPRHLDFHPAKGFLYVINEMAGAVTAFKYDKANNTYQNLQTRSSLPLGFKGYNKSADIHVHPSGKFLYASNRGDHDSIAVFEIDQNTGGLSLVEIQTETIVWPRNFAISPDGRYLLSANLKDDSISIFNIEQETGKLSFTGHKVKVPKPLCIKFLH